jgi:hypothetical protein
MERTQNWDSGELSSTVLETHVEICMGEMMSKCVKSEIYQITLEEGSDVK